MNSHTTHTHTHTHIHSQDVTELYPLKSIEEKAKDHTSSLGTATQQETYYQKTLRVKNIGTLSKKLKMPEITDADRTQAAIQGQIQHVRHEITELWKKLKVID